MRVLLHFWWLLAIIVCASACFLNSCPYRRYGRAPRCTSCGVNMDGMCVRDGYCCTVDDCYKSAECASVIPCPDKYCRLSMLNFEHGFCITQGLCCNMDKCERNAMCS